MSLEKHNETGELYALKGVSKGHLVVAKMTKCARAEKEILMMTDSPFIIKLYNTFQDAQSLYFILEPCLAGDLYQIMHREKESGLIMHGAVQFVAYYVMAVVEAFVHLHTKRVVYRDLKPENLLIKADGTCKLCDMGIAKVIVGMTYTFCGTPDYMAPEMVRQSGHFFEVDWWSLGVLIYELFTGSPPFAADDPTEVYRKIVQQGVSEIEWPAVIEQYRGTVEKLLVTEPSRRLPALSNGVKRLRKEPLFDALEWDRSAREPVMKPPWVPS